MRKIPFSAILFWFFLLFLVGLCYYAIYRNNKVFHYRNQLIVQRLFIDGDIHDEFINKIEKRYTYNEMFFSFKPLESKYWFTDEEVKKYRLDLVDEVCNK